MGCWDRESDKTGGGTPNKIFGVEGGEEGEGGGYVDLLAPARDGEGSLARMPPSKEIAFARAASGDAYYSPPPLPAPLMPGFHLHRRFSHSAGGVSDGRIGAAAASYATAGYAAGAATPARLGAIGGYGRAAVRAVSLGGTTGVARSARPGGRCVRVYACVCLFG